MSDKHPANSAFQIQSNTSNNTKVRKIFPKFCRYNFASINPTITFYGISKKKIRENKENFCPNYIFVAKEINKTFC